MTSDKKRSTSVLDSVAGIWMLTRFSNVSKYSDSSCFAGRQLSSCGMHSSGDALKSVANTYVGESSDANRSIWRGNRCANVAGLSTLTAANLIYVSPSLIMCRMHPTSLMTVAIPGEPK